MESNKVCNSSAESNTGGIIDFELIIFVSKESLEAGSDVILANGKNQHLVISQKLELDSLGKSNDVKLPAKELFVIHRANGGGVFVRLRLGHVAIDARGRSHIEPLVAPEEFGVMDLNEVTFLFVIEGGPGGAVGFVADNQIEVIKPVLMLGAANDIEGMVGREDDTHVPGVMTFRHFAGETLGISGGRVAKFMRQCLDDILVFVSLLTDCGIGANGEGMERRFALLGPLGEDLGKERETWNEKENAPPWPCISLGNLERGEGLTGAASHDELATVGSLEAEEGIVDGGLLMCTRVELGFENRLFVRLEFLPVDLTLLKIVEVDFVDRRGLVVQRVLGIVRPVIGRGDNDSLSEWLLAGGGEEAVDVLF